MVLRSHLLLFFFGRKKMLKEKAISPRSHPRSSHIHTHVYFVHIYEYIYRFSPCGFFGPSRCLIPTPGLISKYPICAVCLPPPPPPSPTHTFDMLPMILDSTNKQVDPWCIHLYTYIYIYVCLYTHKYMYLHIYVC